MRLNNTFNNNVLGGRWRPSHCSERHSVECGHLGRIIEINTIDSISEASVALLTDILMLSVVVLIGLHNSYCRIANFVERPVMTSASESIQTIDHHDVQIANILVCDDVNIACNISGGGIYLTTSKTPDPRLFFGFYRSGSLRENPCRRVIRNTIDT